MVTTDGNAAEIILDHLGDIRDQLKNQGEAIERLEAGQIALRKEGAPHKTGTDVR